MNFASIYAESFRQSIITHAFGGTGQILSSRKPGILGLNGEILIETPSLGCAVSNIKIVFKADSWDVDVPEVSTIAEWLQPRNSKSFKECADWHRYIDGRLCWTRPDCWKTVCNDISNAYNVERAAVVLTKDVSFLLRCHLTADILGIRKWPKEWDAWPHGSN